MGLNVVCGVLLFAARACKVDAEKFCNVTWFFGYKQGQIIGCLREYKPQLSRPCKRQIHKVQKAVRGKQHLISTQYRVPRVRSDSLAAGRLCLCLWCA